MYKVFLAILLVLVPAVLADHGDDDNNRGGNNIPVWQRANSPFFLANNKAMLAELNLNRPNEIWYNPSETYGYFDVSAMGLGYSKTFLQMGPPSVYWGDAYYNQTSGKFLYTQVWPAVLNGQVVYRVQQVSAKVNPPSFVYTDDDDRRPGKQTYSVQWESPPLYEQLLATQLTGSQVAVNDLSIDLSLTYGPSGPVISDEARDIMVPNQKRVYSQMIYLGQTPPGLADDDLWSYWEATVIPTPTDVKTALRLYFAHQLPLLQDPMATAAGATYSVYMYVPPAHARDVPSMTVDEFVAPIRSAVQVADALEKYGIH
jgi:hypothetical protein